MGFLLEASHLRVLRNLRLGTRAASALEKSWEVCLSPVLLSGEGLDAIITEVVREHQRRRDEDYRDWELLLTEYVGLTWDGLSERRCLRRVLLAFLNTGEDVVDAGCGACSGCCPDGNFLPLAERASRIIAFPPILRSCLEAIRKAVDVLPEEETLRRLCAFLERPEGVRWRHAVYLNAERIAREDSDSAGATALLICLVAYGWVQRDESDLHRLFDSLWRRKVAFGRLAEMAATARPESVLLAYWQARAIHAEDATAGLAHWRASCNAKDCRANTCTRRPRLSPRMESCPTLCWRRARAETPGKHAPLMPRSGNWISVPPQLCWRSRSRSSKPRAARRLARKPLLVCSSPL